MIRPLLLTALFSSALILNAHAMSTHELVDLVMEKKVMGHLLTGNRPVIDPSNVHTQPFDPNPTIYRYKSNYFQPSRSDMDTIKKTYEILEQGYHSTLLVKDASGQELRRITVGRRAKRLVANPSMNRLYVLCGGYFGSIWEIDTAQDKVLRKLPGFTPGQTHSPLWNPADIALFPEGNTLAIGSGQLQLIDTRTGESQGRIDLPAGVTQIKALYPLSNTTLGVIATDEKDQKSYFKYQLMSRSLTPAGFLAPPRVNTRKVSFKAPQADPITGHDLSFVSSKNSDFIYVLDAQNMRTLGVVPVDFPVDSLLLTENKQRLFAYHQRFGQISVIELNPLNESNYLSVIQRIRDPRFKSKTPRVLAQHVNDVYLWDGYSDIVASIQQETLETKVRIPFRVKLKSSNEKVMVSEPADKRFFLKDSQIFMEDIVSGSSNYATQLSGVGPVKMLLLSLDRKRLYALDEQNAEVIVIGTQSQKVLRRVKAGKRPSYMRMRRDGHLNIFSGDEGDVLSLNTLTFDVDAVNVLDLGKENPFVLTVFSRNPSQFIHVELPRHLKNVGMMVN